MPIQYPKTLEEVSKATVEGTLSLLKACKENGVKRIVMTSHFGAINHVDELDRPDIFDETIWSDLENENFNFIHKSKTLAEKAAWEFVKSEDSLELVTLCPTMIVGPSLISTRLNISSDFLRKMLRNELAGMYRVMFGLVDVRNVA